MSVLGKIVGQSESGSSTEFKTVIMSKDLHPVNPGYLICCPAESGASFKGIMVPGTPVIFDFLVSNYGNIDIFLIGSLYHGMSFVDPYFLDSSQKWLKVSPVKITLNGIKYIALKVEITIGFQGEFHIYFVNSSHPDAIMFLTNEEVASISDEDDCLCQELPGQLSKSVEEVLTNMKDKITTLDSRITALEGAGSG